MSWGEGDTDGSIANISYFSCEPNKGVFVRKKQIQNVLQIITEIEEAEAEHKEISEESIDLKESIVNKHVQRRHIIKRNDQIDEEFDLPPAYKGDPTLKKVINFMLHIYCCLNLCFW